MKPSKIITIIIAIFTFTFLYEYMVHGVCLQSIYAQTPELWRTPEGMNDKFHFMLLSQFLYAAAFSVFYLYLSKNTNSTLSGTCYGACVGALLAVGQIGMHAYMPISFVLMASWVISTFIESLLAGTLLSTILNCRLCTLK